MQRPTLGPTECRTPKKGTKLYFKTLPNNVMLTYIPCLLIYSFFVFLPSPFKYPNANAAPDSETKERQIRQIETDLSREKEKFLKYGKEEKSLLGQLSNLEQEIVEKKRVLKELKGKIELRKVELKKQQEILSQLDHSLKKIEDRLGKRIVAFYKYAKRGYVQLLAASRDLDQLRKRMKYLKVIMNEDQRLLHQMESIQIRYKQQISLIKEKLTVIDSMEKAENDRLSSIKNDLDKKVILLMKIHKEKEFYETAVKELQFAAQNLKDTLLNLDSDQEKKKELPSDFAGSKGKLPLPFDGKIVKNNKLLGMNIANTNKGIYIEGPSGAEVKVTFPGRVDFSGWLKGYGQIIVINHGARFFTISAHLSQRKREDGDMVRRGEVIGLLGQTGALAGGPSLYFEIRRGGVNLDPLEWLKVD